MKLTFLLFAIGVAASTGWTVPKNTPDGFYSVHENADGTYTQKRLPHMGVEKRSLPLTNSAKFARSQSLDPRQLEVHCAGYAFPNHADVDSALRNLMYQCDYYGPVGGNLDYYAVRGDVVMYFCNFQGNNNQCSSGAAYNAMVYTVSQACGAYEAGWANPAGAGGTYGYELLSHDSNFCGRGE